MKLRRGLSILELLVVIGILAVFIGLLLPAVMQVREAADKTKSMNNIRQLLLAMHHMDSDTNGCLCDGWNTCVHGSLLYYMDGGPALQAQIYAGGRVVFPQFLSPSDPTIGGLALDIRPPEYRKPFYDVTSYAYNPLVFKMKARMDVLVPDGLTNTIAFTEHYSTCGDTVFMYILGQTNQPNFRRPTFADARIPTRPDVVPVVTGNPPRTGPSIAGMTFQVRPTLETCDPRVPNTPHVSGILTGMFDGSVRTVSPRVSEHSYWSAITPDGGEVGGLDS
jgi:type II secretory pathway pseudopilin PulG